MLKRAFALTLALLALTMTLVSCAGKKDDEKELPTAPAPVTPQTPENLVDREEPKAPEEPEAGETSRQDAPPETDTPELPDDYGKGDPPLPEVPPYNGDFDPAEYALFLSGAIGKDIVLRDKFPFSAVFIYFPEIDPALEGWTVYIARPDVMDGDVMVAEDLVPLAQTLALPGSINFDTARPVYTGSGGGSGELEVIVALGYHDKTTYVSWDNFTWTNEDDALTLVYRGELSAERIAEMKEQGLL